MYKQGNILCFLKQKLSLQQMFYVHVMEKRQENNVSSFEEALKPYVAPPKYIDLSQLTGNSSWGWGGMEDGVVVLLVTFIKGD